MDLTTLLSAQAAKTRSPDSCSVQSRAMSSPARTALLQSQDRPFERTVVKTSNALLKYICALARNGDEPAGSRSTACVYGGLPSRAIPYRRRADQITSDEVSDHLRLIAGVPTKIERKITCRGLNGRALLACCIPRVDRWVVVRTFTARIFNALLGAIGGALGAALVSSLLFSIGLNEGLLSAGVLIATSLFIAFAVVALVRIIRSKLRH